MYIYYKLKIMARPRKYTLNENYFEEIDSSNKSYILGFIYADGSINKKNNSLTICLSEKDKDVLKFIKKELNYSGIIKNKIINNRNYSLVNIVSKKLINDLVDLGIIQNKTYLSNSLPKVPINYYNDMIRGFFDGDGSIYRDKLNQYTVCFSSNIKILKNIKEYLLSKDIESSNIRLRNKNSSYSAMLEIRGSYKIEKFEKLIYYNKDLYSLKRKVDKFKEFNEHISNRVLKRYSKDKINSIKELYISGLTQKEIHLKLNIPYSTTRGIIQRLRNKNEIK